MRLLWLFLCLALLFAPLPVVAAEADIPIMVRLVRMVTPEERQRACNEGYILACQLLEQDAQRKTSPPPP